MERRVNLPKKNAGRRLAEKLKNLGKQSPSKTLVEKINKQDDKKKIAKPSATHSDLDVK